MADLFTEIKEPLTPKGKQETQTESIGFATPLKKGRMENREKSLFRVYYKGKDGKFSNEETARVAAIEKENKRLTVNCTYWKRQAERLSADYFTEHEKVVKLEEQIKLLTSNSNLIFEKQNLQQERILPN